MTTQAIYRLHCDSPACTATAVVEEIRDSPDGWTRLSSTTHLASWKPGRKIPGTRRIDRSTLGDLMCGSFSLHLCPDHPDAFADHLPQTEGDILRPRESYRRIVVRCSCDWRTTTNDLIIVGDPTKDGPRRQPEQAWWRHLPDELKGYATRDLKAKAAA